MKGINRRNQRRNVSATNKQQIKKHAKYWPKKIIENKEWNYHLNNFSDFLRHVDT